jgi:hypothetical protein
LSPLEALVMGGTMGKLGREELAKLCDQVARVIETDPKGAALVARRLATSMRPATPAVSAK